MALQGNPLDWGSDTRQGVVMGALLNSAPVNAADHIPGGKCSTCKAAYGLLKPALGTGELRWFRNDGSEIGVGPERGKRARWTIAEVHAYATKWAEPSEAPVEIVAAAATPTGFDIDAEKRFFIEESRRIRRFAEEREIDHISYRPAKDARRMIEAGIPAKACLYAMTMHWEDTSRMQAGIAEYDPATEFPGGLHAYLDALVEARVLIMLTGPAGMGKSYWCQSLAERQDLSFGSLPMAEGATPSWFLGAQRLNGFGESRFLQIWRDGGVFLMDEMDAADPNMLLVVNNALANDRLDNPVNGEHYDRHADAILIAACNTLGTGADAQYTGRNQLDFSTLDRWRMGRVFVGYSESVEETVMFA